METNTILAKNIYNFRKQKGLTQEKLAEIMGVSYQAVSKWENEKSLPDVYVLPLLAKTFGCSIDALFSHQNDALIGNLKEITIEMLASIVSLEEKKRRILEIARDGKVDESELEDFVFIKKELERISSTVDALQIWLEKMIADEKINVKKYKHLIKQ
ncbi:MAG: helix-turn-helix domain-containing protein [Clostridia bacterium]|nr:helix-turn-helix domain-containing protein [Clostridia bacterium]